MTYCTTETEKYFLIINRPAKNPTVWQSTTPKPREWPIDWRAAAKLTSLLAQLISLTHLPFAGSKY